MQPTPEAFLPALTPYRQGMVVAGAWMCTGAWLADRCADAGLPVVLGHALSMPARHGGQAQNDPIDSHTMAARRRGGRLPHAAVEPAQRRAPRALLRRQLPRAPQRAALLAHVPNTNSQYPLPAMGNQLADTANRAGVAERVAAPAGQQRLASALALLTSDDAWRRAGALPIVPTAQHQDAPPRYRRPTGPGLGTIRRRVRRDAIPASARVPRGQAVVSSCRRVKGAQKSAGKRPGTSGPQSGTAPLTWAVAAAAGLCLSDPPAAQQSLARLAQKQHQGKARPVLAQPVARAGYPRLPRPGAFEREQCCPRDGRGAAAPGAALAPPGRTLPKALDTASGRASVPAQTPIGHTPLRPAL